MEPRIEHPADAPSPSEDELARQMIERIARQVDLESGRVPLHSETEPGPEPEVPAGEPSEAADEPEERSEEDVSRELVERIAREVDEEPRG